VQEDQKQPPTITEKDYRRGHRQRLRDRFRKGGPKAVQEYELLELVLFRAIPRRDVKQLAHQLIDRFGDISAVLSAPRTELESIKGVSERVVDEFELVRGVALKVGQSTIMNKKALANWDALVAYCRTKMAESAIEEFHVIFLDKQNQIIADEQMGRGTVDHTPVYPREVIKRALEKNATALIIAHNHPSGDPSPSRADIDMTHKLRDLAQGFNIVLHDHLVVARGAVLSFKEKGLL
jgi:DNA repair protein RadC